MKLKIIAIAILNFGGIYGTESGEPANLDREYLKRASEEVNRASDFDNRTGENILAKEVPAGEALLMVQIRYEDEAQLRSGYAGPLVFRHNKLAESIRAVEVSMENCCSEEKFHIRTLDGMKPFPYWGGMGIEPLNGKAIAFSGKIENRQIVPNEGVKISHFRVLKSDGSGTAVVFLIGPLEELKKAYKIRLGQVFTWDSPIVYD